MDYEIVTQQPFNKGLEELKRLHQWESLVYEYRHYCDPVGMIRSLNIVRSIITPYLKLEDQAKALQTYRDLRDFINDEYFGDSFNFDELDEYLDWLRSKSHEAGLLMPKGDDPHRALE